MPSTWYCASALYADVDAVVNAVTTLSGDTVVIPNGDEIWTSVLFITKGIFLVAENPCVFPVDAYGVPSGEPTSVFTSIGVNTGNKLIDWNLPVNTFASLCGFRIYNGGNPSWSNALVFINGRTDTAGTGQFYSNHMFWDRTNALVAIGPSDVHGCIDHNVFVGGATDSFTPFYTVYDPSYNHVGDFGDYSWYTGAGAFGTYETLFIEANYFKKIGTPTAAIDGQRGRRIVVRNNTFINCWIEGHGTEGDQRHRGCVTHEYYRNTLDVGNVRPQPVVMRSGSGYIFQNNVSNMMTPAYYANISAYRLSWWMNPYGQADGTQVWDVNDPANPYIVCTVLSVNTGTRVITLTASVLGGTNTYLGYTVLDMNITPGGGVTAAALITANTVNTITYGDAAGTTDMVPVAGDTLHINKVLHLFDGVGRFGGSLISGGTDSTAPTTGFPGDVNDQTTEGLYGWDNVNDDDSTILANAFLNRTGLTQVSNTDYFEYVAVGLFDGSTGCTSGTATQKNAVTPTHIGVAFWVDNEGVWNTSGDGRGQGQLYKCLDGATWSLYYTPALYPHPLASGGSPATDFEILLGQVLL